MAIEQPPGKISADVFHEVVLRHLGADDPDLLVPPQHGVDVGVVRLGGGQVMALTSDPVFLLPSFGWRRAAWFAVHVLASDAATSGLDLRWLTVDLNLPLTLADEDLAELWEALSEAAADLGLAIVTGHTGRYAGCDWPMVGGATCLAVGPEDRYVTPRGARPGDRLLVTEGAAIEATALFGAAFGDRLRAELGAEVAREADALFGSMTVVPEARALAAYGLREEGVTAMHDATEGGVLGGIVEIADASGGDVVVERDAIPMPDASRAVCDHVGIDPYVAISEGTLLATVGPEHVDGALAALTDAGILAADIGHVVAEGEGRQLLTAGGSEPLTHPGQDPFWAAFGRWTLEAAGT